MEGVRREARLCDLNRSASIGPARANCDSRFSMEKPGGNRRKQGRDAAGKVQRQLTRRACTPDRCGSGCTDFRAGLRCELAVPGIEWSRSGERQRDAWFIWQAGKMSQHAAGRFGNSGRKIENLALRHERQFQGHLPLTVETANAEVKVEPLAWRTKTEPAGPREPRGMAHDSLIEHKFTQLELVHDQFQRQFGQKRLGWISRLA